MPTRGRLFLIEVNDLDPGLLPNALAGVREGAGRPARHAERHQALDELVAQAQALKMGYE